MYKIKTRKGIYEFNQKDIFAGMQQINKEIASRNLVILKDILDKHNLFWGLAYGTVLGAVREHDFIEHDEDIDTYILSEDEELFKDLLFDLRVAGLELVRYERRGLYSLMREGEYIDIYVFGNPKDGLRNSGSDFMLEKHLKETMEIDFHGNKYRIPKDYVNCMEILYGSNWQVPIKWLSYDINKWKSIKQKSIIHIKRNLPDFLYYWLLNKHCSKVKKDIIRKIHLLSEHL